MKIVNKYFILILPILIGTTVFAQNIKERKNILFDKLIKDGVDSIITIHDGYYGGYGRLGSIKLKGKRKPVYCSTEDGVYYFFWMKDAKIHYTAFTNCYEIPIGLLPHFEAFDYFMQHKEPLTSLKYLQGSHCIKINDDIYRYSMDCDSIKNRDSFITMSHYGYYEIQVNISSIDHNFGEIEEYSFCYYKTKNLVPVKILNSFFTQLKVYYKLVQKELKDNRIILLDNWK